MEGRAVPNPIHILLHIFFKPHLAFQPHPTKHLRRYNANGHSQNEQNKLPIQNRSQCSFGCALVVHLSLFCSF